MQWQWVLVNSNSDERWRRGRKLLDRGLRPGASVSYRLTLQARARVLLSRLLANPHQWKDHIDLSVELAFVTDCVAEFSGKCQLSGGIHPRHDIWL